ncbi:MAG: ArnT family glycosyltransferase [Anaerolineales bacterium]
MILIDKLIKRAKESPAWLPLGLAATGLLVYIVQAIHFAHTTISSLDEGAYLYKGWLFATGQYRPFEPYGALTNKAPLAFLIPGYVQLIFGPGLLTGRYLAVLFGTLTAAATWWTARRLSNSWLAAAAVWTMALQPAVIKIYSEGVSQATTVFFMSLVLLLSLGAGRPLWQLVLAGFFAGVVILVRQNMVLVLPLLILYILWEHGRKPAFYAALAGVAVLLFFHILYWPHIMQLWTPWLPGWLRSALPAGTSIQSSGTSVWDPQLNFWQRLLSLFQGIRFYFVATVGLMAGLLLWPKGRNWRSGSHFRAAVFLATLFAGLLLMHSWASLTRDYCVFCFTPYLAFFHVSAILFATILIQVWERNAGLWKQLILIALLLILFAGVGYSLFEDVGDVLINLNIVPRSSGGQLQAGFSSVWEVLANKFALERNAAKRIASTAAGGALGVAFLLGLLIYWRMRNPRANYAYMLATLVLGFGLVSGPLLASSGGQPDCQMDVISANEKVGAHLARYIPAGSQIYWNGGLSVAPLLYAADINVYAPQINGSYSRRNGGDAQTLLQYGLWNDALSRQWWEEADFILVEAWRYSKDAFPPSEFDELPRSPGPTSCVTGSEERIFRRK